MFRSIRFFNDLDDAIQEESAFSTDAVVLGAELSVLVFSLNVLESNVVQVASRLKQSPCKRFVTIENTDAKKDKERIKQIDFSSVDGFFLKNATKKALNDWSLKCREIEANNKLAFGTLGIIASIDNLEAVLEARKIANYARIISLYVDTDAITDSLGIERTKDGEEINHLRERLVVDTAIHHKHLIDGLTHGDMMPNLEYLRRIGFCGKAVVDSSQIDTIHRVFSPTNHEIESAHALLNAQFEGALRGEKTVYFNSKRVTPSKIRRAQNVLRMAMALKMTDAEIPPVVKRRKIKKTRPAPVKFYSLGEEIANAISHGAGVILGIVALTMLIVKGVSTSEEGPYVWSGVLFGLSVVLLYLMSTLYHSLSLRKTAKQVFRRFDHASIYLLIAGSYTPFLLHLLSHPYSTILVLTIWGLAASGILLKVIWIKKFPTIHLALYIALGWLPAMFLLDSIQSMQTAGIVMLVAGGVSYTVGVLFYALKLFKFTHMVWHLFCILGTLFHFLTVYMFL